MSDPFRHATVESLAGPWKGSIKIGPFGSQLKREDMVEHGHKVYGQENVIANDWSAGDRRVSGAKFSALRSCELHPGDVVLSMMGTVGKCAVFPPGAEPGLMDSHLLRIQPNPELVTLEFLATVLQAENVVGRQVSSMSHGSIMAGLSSSIVRRFTVPLPPLNEQPMLSAILDTLDTTIRQTEAIIEKLKQVKQGLLHDLLTRGIDANGELRPPQSQAPKLYKESPLGWIPRGWEARVLNDIVDQRRPIVYGILMPGQGHEGGVPVVKVKDIMGGSILIDQLLLTSPAIDLEYKRSRLKRGDLLFTIRGSVGRTAFVPAQLEDANITQDTARIGISGVYARFVREYLAMPLPVRFIATHTLGVAVQGINLRDVRRIPIAVPRPDEATAIADILDAINSRMSAEALDFQKLKLEKSGLMDDLLTGRVRVTPLLA